MILDVKSRRRWFAAMCLVAAVGMLVAGETVLKGRLSAAGFLFYWLGCFGLTMVAIFVALVDARAARLQGRREQRDLMESTLGRCEKQEEDEKK